METAPLAALLILASTIDPNLGEPIRRAMWRAALGMVLACSACGVAHQPESGRTVAAFEVPLPTAREREEFLALLSHEAQGEGFHLDAANAEQLQYLSGVSPMTIHAAVWRGENDEGPVASVMNQEDHLGRAWITFAKGEEPARVARFREKVMRRARERWPQTASLPIMPSGSIPNPYQLRRADGGYRLRPEFISDYEVGPESPLVAGE